MIPASRDAPPRRERISANEAFKRSWSRWLSCGLLAAVALHFAFFQLFPRLRAADLGADGGETTVLELPPEVAIPPPPEDVARPAEPTVPDAEVDDDVTISPTDIDAFDRAPPPPPASVEREARDVRYIPREVDPRATNDAEIRDLLQRHYPRGLRDAGVEGSVTLWIFVDESGEVAEARVHESSGYEAFDRAALEVAEEMEFEPAVNRDRPIGVWVVRRISFRIGR